MGMDDAARTLLSALACAQGLPHDIFGALLDLMPLDRPGSSRLEAVRYKAEGTSLGCEAHEDRGLITLVWCTDGGALEVCMPSSRLRPAMPSQGAEP